MYDMESLDSTHLDIIREIGNIGAGHAATALSSLINRRIDLKVPVVNVIPFNKLEDVIDNVDSPVAGIYLTFEGDIDGSIIFILDCDSAHNIKTFFSHMEEEREGDTLTEFHISVLKEIGNILAGSYLKALYDLTGLAAAQSIPLFAYDMAGAILSVPLIEFGQVGDNAMFIDTEFIEGSRTIKGHIFIIPQTEAFELIIKSLIAG